MQQFATPAPVSAVLDIPAGHIRFIAAERDDTIVEILPTNASKSRDVTASKEIQVTCDNGVLRIQAPAKSGILGRFGSVEVTVQLPAGSHVEAKTAAGDFRGVGRLGDVTFESAQSQVKIDETAGARLTVQAGDVLVGRLGGTAEISTQQGSLHITEAVGGTVTLSTQHGDISVGAARGVSAALDAGTARGRIDNSLNNTEGPSPALTVRATTSYGNITARSL